MTSDYRAAPTGTLTFLFSDVEGSTRLTQRLGPVVYRLVLERHQAILRSAFTAHDGVERGTEGDSFFVVFTDAGEAIAAAVDGQRGIAQADWADSEKVRVRMGLHTGAGVIGGDDYVGIDINRAARIASAANGGQVLLSEATRVLGERDLPAGVSLREIGAHRLKDLDQPERLWQLVIDGLQSEFPPLRTLDTRAGNLPPRLTSFVDREPERGALAQLLDASRLVTITGPGGIGKTSLAVSVAAAVADRFPDGTWFVPLDSLSDPDLVPTAIAHAFHLEVEDQRSPFDRVADYVRDRHLLLVLDNFEHLQPAARFIRATMDDARKAWFLVASQAPLHIAGEQEFPLEPLTVPADDAIHAIGELGKNPAVQLFLDRARSVRPGFELEASNADAIAAICARLEGLPLAIELAAAQIRLLSPGAILDRLSKELTMVAVSPSDVPERQRTLEALVAWSYDLLPDDQRALLVRLAVFAGGAGLREIERIAEGVAAIPDPIGALSGLVDRSLVRVDPHNTDRFRVLETIRVYAAMRLRDTGNSAEVERCHAEIFAELAEEAEPNLYRSRRHGWLERLALEHDNLRAALDRMETLGELTLALRIASGAWRFWQQAGHLAEGIPRIERLLRAAETAANAVDPLLMSRAEEAAGGMAYWQRIRDAADVEGHYQRSLAYARDSGDADREAWAVYNLSFAYDYIPSSSLQLEPQPERAEALRQEAIARFRNIGDERGVAYTLWARSGSPLAIVKPLPELREQLLAALQLFRDLGEAFGETWARLSLSMVEAEAGDLEGARSAILEAGSLFVRDGDLSGQMVVVEALASLAARFGDARLAVRLDAAGQAARQLTGTLTPPIAPLRAPIAAARASLGPDVAQEEEAIGRQLPLESILDSALGGSQASIREVFDFTRRVRMESSSR